MLKMKKEARKAGIVIEAEEESKVNSRASAFGWTSFALWAC